MLGWWLSPTITLLREQLSTSTVMMALFPTNEGWLFVKAMVSGILNFQVSIESDSVINTILTHELNRDSHGQT
jgi:hypothetical protein